MTEAEEEFQESDILFRDDSPGYEDDAGGDSPESSGEREPIKSIDIENPSDPIDIPGSRNAGPRNRRVLGSSDSCAGEFVPPHVIIGRRVAEKLMALSICTGKGRTVRGRDLSEFRNTIFRITGFLDA